MNYLQSHIPLYEAVILLLNQYGNVSAVEVVVSLEYMGGWKRITCWSNKFYEVRKEIVRHRIIVWVLYAFVFICTIIMPYTASEMDCGCINKGPISIFTSVHQYKCQVIIVQHTPDETPGLRRNTSPILVLRKHTT